MDCVGFISVSVGEFECEEDAAMFGGLPGFRSRLGERDVVECEIRGVLCFEGISSSELSSLTPSAGSRATGENPSLILFLSLANASFLRACHTDFIGARGCIRSG